MKPLKVIFFIPAFAGGGAERQCIYLVNALSKREDMSVGLAHFHEGINYSLVDHANVRLFPIPTRSNYDPRNAWRLRRLIAQQRPDIVFSWLHASDAFTWGARALGAEFKWVMAERDSWYPPDLRYWIRGQVGRHADLIVSNSNEGDRYWSRRGVPDARRRVVGNVLPDTWFDVRETWPSAPTICYAGRMEPQKDVLRLADAFRALSDRRSNIRFVMVGEGSLRSEVETKLACTAGNAISMLRFQKEVRPVFEHTSVFVNISTHEGKPNTVIENIALGNRVVLSRIPEHVELVGDDYPFLVETGSDPQAISVALEAALANPVSEDERQVLRLRLDSMRVEKVQEQYASMFFDLADNTQ